MSNSPAAVEAVFRAEYGELCSSLLSAFGYQRFDLVEEALQSAFERALERWPDGGVPNNPAGWLYAVARNTCLEALRHAVVVERASADKVTELSDEVKMLRAENRDLRDRVVRIETIINEARRHADTRRLPPKKR